MTEELLPRAMHLCYTEPWSTRLAGVDTLALLTDKCAISPPTTIVASGSLTHLHMTD